MTLLAGIDIGGTKCAVSIGELIEQGVTIKGKKRFLTPDTPERTIEQLMKALDQLIEELQISSLRSIGISCGGPLNSREGVILSPPNLPGWDHIKIVSLFKERYGLPVALQNDANAGALAEWQWGAGQGSQNMIFLTFGTGMGAGLILNGRLYSGTNDLAGEVGHVRLADEGPIGFGKPGSFEGFCSGGGIAKLATSMAEEAIKKGAPPSYCRTIDQLDEITAKKVGEAAQSRDTLALEVFSIVGYRLGAGLAMLIDILNPEKIIIGSIYGRQQQILELVVFEVLKREAINHSLAVCEVQSAGLGERIGDLASLSVALHAITEQERVKKRGELT